MNDNKDNSNRNKNQQGRSRNRSNRNNNRYRHPSRRNAKNRSNNGSRNNQSSSNQSQQNANRVNKPIDSTTNANTGQTAVKPTVSDWRWILIAKGLGILLVVIGHFQPSIAPQWYKGLINVIYSFHMPLFFLLSGFLYVYGKQKFGPLVISKLKRLAVPFISIGAIFFVVKWLVGQFANLDHPIGPNSLIDLVLNPATSFMPLLWFVHALLLMFLVFVPMRAVLRYTPLVFLVIVVLNTVWIPQDMPSVHKILAHFPFFIAGIWLRESGQLSLIRKSGWLRIAGVSAIVFALIYWLGFGDAIYLEATSYPIRLALGLLGALIVVALSSRLDLAGSWVASAAAVAGLYSMTIYLVHTLFESGIRIIAFQKLQLDAGLFVPVAIVAIAVGMIMPLLLEKYVLRKITLTRKLILGLN